VYDSRRLVPELHTWLVQRYITLLMGRHQTMYLPIL